MLRRVGEEGTCLLTSKAADGFLLSAETRLTYLDKEAGDYLICTEPSTGSIQPEFLHGVWHEEVKERKFTKNSDYVTLSAGGKVYTCEILGNLEAEMKKERASAARLGIGGFMVRFSHLDPCLKDIFNWKLKELVEVKTNAADEVARVKAEEALSRLKHSLFFITALDDVGVLLCKWYEYDDEEDGLGGGYLVQKFECGGCGETKAKPAMNGLWNKGKNMKQLVSAHHKSMEEACKGFDENGVGGNHFFIKVQKLNGRFDAVEDYQPLFEPFRIVKLRDGDRKNLEHTIASLHMLEKEVRDGLTRLGIKTIDPIQSLVFELLMVTGYRGILGRVKTGKWKALRFGIQIANRILMRKKKQMDAKRQSGEYGRCPLALVLVPTFQLGKEVEKQFRGTWPSLVTTCLDYNYVNKKICSVILRNIDIFIGTPNCIEDMLKSEENKLPEINLSELIFTVFVEADNICESTALQSIFSKIPAKCKNVIFAKATMSEGVRKLAHEWFRLPIAVDLQYDSQGFELGRPVQVGGGGGSSSGYGGSSAMYGQAASSFDTERRSPLFWSTAESSSDEDDGQTPARFSSVSFWGC